MTQDDVIEMAKECNLIGMRPHLDGIYSEALVAFANLVAAKERERMIYAGPHVWANEAILLERKACAEICDGLRLPEDSDFHWIPDGRDALRSAANAIRARGEA